MDRIDKENYYLDIAQTVQERSTCLRKRYGAIIVRNDEIVSTGYNGAPRGRSNCSDLGYCLREKMKIPSGERYELCRSVHAEANAIISAARSECIGGTLYLVGMEARTNELAKNITPCSMVPEADHQCRHCQGGDAGDTGKISGDQCPGLGVQRRYNSGPGV